MSVYPTHQKSSYGFRNTIYKYNIAIASLTGPRTLRVMPPFSRLTVKKLIKNQEILCRKFQPSLNNLSKAKSSAKWKFGDFLWKQFMFDGPIGTLLCGKMCLGSYFVCCNFPPLMLLRILFNVQRTRSQ